MDRITYFLVIAEELNLSRAAKRLYVSQQCLSAFLKNLEEEYGTVLFNRKPKLSLTPAGNLLAQTYRQIQILENNLSRELDQLSDGAKGHINIGIPSSRSLDVIPGILSDYLAEYPNVTINIVDGLTHHFEEELLAGRLDFFIGIKPHAHPDVEIVPLIREQLYVVLSNNLLKRYFPDEYPACKERFAKGIDLHEFEQVPFILYDEDSRISSELSRFLSEQKIRLRTRVSSNNGQLRIELSAKDYGACTCTQSRLRNVAQFNREHPELSGLNVFPIRGFSDAFETSLVYLKQSYHARHYQSFIHAVRRAFSRIQAEFRHGNNLSLYDAPH